MEAIGAGYLMGMYFFVRVLFTKRWHWIAAGFPPITSFTLSMLLATIVHWDRFNPDRLAYYLWIIVYIITPVLVAFLWWQNRMTDPGPGASDEVRVPLRVRQAFGIGGALIIAFSVLVFIFPSLLIGVFPWPLTDFSARLMAGWLSIAGVGGITLALEPRWSGWRYFLSKWANSIWVRTILGVQTRDATAGFKCWSRRALEKIPLEKVRSNGYVFQVEMAYLCEKMGLKILEWPIYFEDRRIGKSKMSVPVKFEAAWRVFEIRWRYGGLPKDRAQVEWQRVSS